MIEVKTRTTPITIETMTWNENMFPIHSSNRSTLEDFLILLRFKPHQPILLEISKTCSRSCTLLQTQDTWYEKVIYKSMQIRKTDPETRRGIIFRRGLSYHLVTLYFILSGFLGVGSTNNARQRPLWAPKSIRQKITLLYYIFR